VIVGTGKTDGGASREVRKDSDALLDAVREIHDLEREKRGEQISTPEFHDKAREITDRSREVFRIAAEEEKAGEETDDAETATIEEVKP
jgi:chromatin remodeling complex protein RSC6